MTSYNAVFHTSKRHPHSPLLAAALLILGASQAGGAALAEGNAYGQRPDPSAAIPSAAKPCSASKLKR